MKELAHKLNISRTTLYRRLKQEKLPFDFVSAVSRAVDHELLPHGLREDLMVFSRNDESDIVMKYINMLEMQLELHQVSTITLVRKV